MRWFVLSPLAACVENTLSTKDDAEAVFDTGDEVTNPFDSDTTTLPDTADTGEPPQCDDQYFGATGVAKLAECYAEAPEVGTFTPVVEWEVQSFAYSGSSVSCMMQPVVCSLTDDDGDGNIDENDTPDVVIITYSNGVVRALSGEDGTELWGSAGAGSIQITGGAACGDLDGDGVQEVIAATSRGVDVFDNEGTLSWSATDCGSGHMYGTSDAPGIADMDADGDPEVLIGNCIYDKDGNLEGRGSYGYGGTASNVGSAAFAVDIDQDGELELVAGNALYDKSGNDLWYNGESDGYTAVGNFDSDDNGEIVVTGSAMLRVQDDDGTVWCETTIPGASGGYGGPPTVADFDGDLEAEIGVAANSTYTVFETDCTELWQYAGTTDPSSGNTGSSVFDFEGDGIADVVYADERWVWVFDGSDGTVKMQDTNHSNNTWLEYPTIADINADGSADIAVCNTPGSWGSLNGVTVFGDADASWREGRRIWNQHGYSITNVDDDGSIPQYQETNWLSYNNFRSGDLTPGEGYAGPDLYPHIHDVCVDECGSGNVTLWVSIGNQGYADIDEPVVVEIWGDDGTGWVLLSTIDWTAALPQGVQSVAQSVELSGVPDPLYDLMVAVDGGDDETYSEIDECYEDNNTENWGDVVCP